MEIQQVPGPLEIRPRGGTREPIVADLGKAPQQDVVEEARDERVHWERDAARLLRARVRVAEGDAPVRERLQALIGERDVMDVAREMADRLRAPTDLLHAGRSTIPTWSATS